MPIEILGMVGTKEVSESLGSFDGPVIDTDYLTRFALAQVADAVAEYRKAGVDAVLIRGFDPLNDVVGWGRELVPLLRAQDGSAQDGSAQESCTPAGPLAVPQAVAPEVLKA